MKKLINETIDDKVKILNDLRDSEYMKQVESVAKVMTARLKNNGKILLAGNGGSAADAQHFAGEIVGRFMKERKSLPAISLCVDPSVMTCIGNDYGYDAVFERQIQGLACEGDILVAISTSGNSENLIRAVAAARETNVITVGLIGRDGGRMKKECDYALVVPSWNTPRIQEIHTFTVHLICQYIDERFCEE